MKIKVLYPNQSEPEDKEFSVVESNPKTGTYFRFLPKEDGYSFIEALGVDYLVAVKDAE